ncbi:hypothetical protein [Streptomyces sp. NPDC004976]
MTGPSGPAPTADNQIPEVYARQPVLRRLVPRLVGLSRDHHRRVPHHEFTDDLPVVLLSGRHGTGKSAMLDDLQQAYAPDTGPWPGPRVPFARINCAELQERAGVGPETSNNSHAVEMLVELVAQLSRPVAGFGRLRFPRTTAGLLAVVSARRPGNDGERRVADRHAATLMGVPPDVRPRPTWDALFRHALPASPDGGSPDPAWFPEAAVRAFLGGRRRRPTARRLTSWYETYRSEADNRLRGLPPGASGQPRPVPAAERAPFVARLCQEFHQGRGFRRGVERMLAAAFLDDVRYGPFRRANRTPRPLVLLDNAHTDAGRDLLELLLDQRADRGARDRMVVIATELHGDDSPDPRGDAPDGEDAPYPEAARRSLPDIGTDSGWTRESTAPSAGVLLLPLPPLECEHLERMLRRDDHASFDPYIASALHDLTRGHPMGARRLCEAVVDRAGAGEWVAAGELLDLVHPGGAGESVVWRLLDTLVGSENHDELCLFSLAWDREAAERLAERWVPRRIGDCPRPTEPPTGWSGSGGRADRAAGPSSRTASCAPCWCTRCAVAAAAAASTGPARTPCSPSTTGGAPRAGRGVPRATNGPASCGTGWRRGRRRRSSTGCTRSSSARTATRSTGCTPCAPSPMRHALRETPGSRGARRSRGAAGIWPICAPTRARAWRSRRSTGCCTPCGTRRTNWPRPTGPWSSGSDRTCPSCPPST